MNLRPFCIFSLILMSSKDAFALDLQDIKQLKKENLAAIPYSRSVVSFSDNEQVVILDNPRFVVKGQLYDMWSKELISSKNDIYNSINTYPLSQLKINSQQLLESVIRYDSNDIQFTLFINPFDDSNLKFIEEYKKNLSDKSLRVIYTLPSAKNGLTDKYVKQYYSLTCNVPSIKSLADIEVLVKNTPVDKPCSDLAYKTVGLLQFLNINNPPLLVSNKTEKSFNYSVPMDKWLQNN
ncbi:hypothetical protein HWA77_10735 [Photobacterium damselae subsp. damselae]|uniref:Uncharacterized protein n=1 Tax=Photobacterium damselae subsp. damselae TaxID=85581 RepID=A0A850QM34_PHODD|nr:hypothetical protein [Photobacterium damselae subsp. damselae]